MVLNGLCRLSLLPCFCLVLQNSLLPPFPGITAAGLQACAAAPAPQRRGVPTKLWLGGSFCSSAFLVFHIWGVIGQALCPLIKPLFHSSLFFPSVKIQEGERLCLPSSIHFWAIPYGCLTTPVFNRSTQLVATASDSTAIQHLHRLENSCWTLPFSWNFM